MAMRDQGDDDRSVARTGGPDAAGPVPAVDPRRIELLARAAIARLADPSASHPVVTAPDVDLDGFCRALVGGDFDHAAAMLRRLTALRQDYAQIADGLLSEAARRLGRAWEEDKLSFADVSVGISQIIRLNQQFRRRHVPLIRHPDRTAFFATLPGQAHNLGLLLAAEAFRGEGWAVELRLDAPAQEIAALALRLRPRLVGLTISREDKRHHVAQLVTTLRALPVRFRIMLGGRGAAALATSLPPGRIDRVVTDIAAALDEARLLAP
jgi:methanogenic corrinoid protein MtbC1